MKIKLEIQKYSIRQYELQEDPVETSQNLKLIMIVLVQAISQYSETI